MLVVTVVKEKGNVQEALVNQGIFTMLLLWNALSVMINARSVVLIVLIYVPLAMIVLENFQEIVNAYRENTLFLLIDRVVMIVLIRIVRCVCKKQEIVLNAMIQ